MPYNNGGKIFAVARIGGKEVARHELRSTGRASAFQFVAESPAEWTADGMALQYIKIFAVDNKGNAVPTATGTVTVEMSGAARLVALDNEDHYTGETFAGTTRLLHRGFALAVLRATHEVGEVQIRASCDGMKSRVLKLKTRSQADH